ncbi:hypothetical protein MBLNU230_g4053t1 [Neophaeotheca triangularis]
MSSSDGASVDIGSTRSAFQAVFALDVSTAGIALILLGLASLPTFKRLKERRLSMPTKRSGSDTPLKTTLGTYLFLWPALFCLAAAYTFQFVTDLLQSSGSIQYNGDLQLKARFPVENNSYGYSTSVLSFATSLALIFTTILLNGGVWIHSNHVTSNGTGVNGPGTMSKIVNTLELLLMLAIGLAAWGRGMYVRDSLQEGSRTWSDAVDNDLPARALYTAFRCVVIAASISVSIEVLRRYAFVKNNSSKNSSERKNLVRFAVVIVPLIWIRNVFIVVDIVLVYINTSGWSTASNFALVFLLIIFGQLANLTILAMVFWGAWRMGKTLSVFGDQMSS